MLIKNVKFLSCAKSTYIVLFTCVNSIYGKMTQETHGSVEKRIKIGVDN